MNVKYRIQNILRSIKPHSVEAEKERFQFCLVLSVALKEKQSIFSVPHIKSSYADLVKHVWIRVPLEDFDFSGSIAVRLKF